VKRDSHPDGRECRFGHQPVLHLDGPVDGIQGAAELGQHTISGSIDNPSVPDVEQRLDEVLAHGQPLPMGRILVIAHQSRVARDIKERDHREPPPARLSDRFQ
jgi:hypothetical protein